MKAIIILADGGIERYDICTRNIKEVVEMHRCMNFSRVMLRAGDVEITFTRKIYESNYDTDIFNNLDYIIKNFKIPDLYNNSKALKYGITVNKKIKVEKYNNPRWTNYTNTDVISFNEVTDCEYYMIIDTKDKMGIGQEIRVVVEDNEIRLRHNCTIRKIFELKNGYTGVLLEEFSSDNISIKENIKEMQLKEDKKESKIKVHFYKNYASKNSNEIISKVDRIFDVDEFITNTEHHITFKVKGLTKKDFEEILIMNDSQRAFIEVKDNICKKEYDCVVISATPTDIYNEHKFMVSIKDTKINFYGGDLHQFNKTGKYTSKDNKKLYDAYVTIPCIEPFVSNISGKVTEEKLPLDKIFGIYSRIDFSELQIVDDNKIITVNLDLMREYYNLNSDTKLIKLVNIKNEDIIEPINISIKQLINDLDNLDMSDKNIVCVDYMISNESRTSFDILNRKILTVIRNSINDTIIL